VHARRWIFVALAAVVALVLAPGWALATTAYTDQVKGLEYSATSTVGKFAGTARGDLPGTWNATVVHQEISANPASISGGSFTLYSVRAIQGTFTGGAVTRREQAPGCVNEVFDVDGTLSLTGGGSGSFDVVLTHLRRQVPQLGCVTYAATVTGALTLTRAASTAA